MKRSQSVAVGMLHDVYEDNQPEEEEKKETYAKPLQKCVLQNNPDVYYYTWMRHVYDFE